MFLEVLGPLAAAVSVVAWGVRGRSSQLVTPTIWKGPANRKAIALTFDDGPSESTTDVLRILDDFGVSATFFQCGHHVRRLPQVAARVAAAGHEIGNHTDSHAALYCRSPRFIREQVERGQEIITSITGVTPKLFRPTYGVRWFGLTEVLEELGLKCVMWTTISRDWRLSGQDVAAYMRPKLHNGSIFCFHDGRELLHHPDITPTIESLQLLIPRWLDEGYEVTTVSRLIGAPGGPSAP